MGSAWVFLLPCAEAQCWQQQRTEEDAAMCVRCSETAVSIVRVYPQFFGCCSAQFIFLSPFIQSNANCSNCSRAAWNCFYFTCCAWLHQRRAGTLQDGVKNICSLETSGVPGRRREARAVLTCFLLLLWFLLRNWISAGAGTDRREPGAAVSAGQGPPPPPLTSVGPATQIPAESLLICRSCHLNQWVLAALACKLQGAAQQVGEWVARVRCSCPHPEGMYRAINITPCCLYSSQHSSLGKSHSKYVWHFKHWVGMLFFRIELQSC